jgi:hypothetical protein
MRRCVWSRNLVNEEDMTRDGPQRHEKEERYETQLITGNWRDALKCASLNECSNVVLRGNKCFRIVVVKTYKTTIRKISTLKNLKT